MKLTYAAAIHRAGANAAWRSSAIMTAIIMSKTAPTTEASSVNRASCISAWASADISSPSSPGRVVLAPRRGPFLDRPWRHVAGVRNGHSEPEPLLLELRQKTAVAQPLDFRVDGVAQRRIVRPESPPDKKGVASRSDDLEFRRLLLDDRVERQLVFNRDVDLAVG